MQNFLRLSHYFKKGFTLIELLVVISIIGILAALMFPAVGGAMDSARKSSAQNDVVQIVNAVTSYETEYGKLPPSNTTVSGDLLAALMGTNTNNNSRKIQFINPPDYKKNKGGFTTNGAYVDPWSNNLAISMDTDYDNSIQVSTNGEATGTVALRKKVAVWNVTTNTKQQVRSW